MAPRDYANTRFSPLDQINAQNVGQLSLAWSFSLGSDRGQEAAPLVVNGTLYVVAPYWGGHPNQVFALDAATGDLKWSYAPPPNPAAKGEACCDVVTRGLACDNGKVHPARHDMPVNGQQKKTLVPIGRNGYIYVIDRATGQVYSADPYETINATKGIDLTTGKPEKNDEKTPTTPRCLWRGKQSDGASFRTRS